MKVLLCEDVGKVGWVGDVVEVKAGYARNYLLPYGIAVVPTEANIKSLAKEKARSAHERKLAYEQLEHLGSRVGGAEVVVAARANEQGHLFGAVHVSFAHERADASEIIERADECLYEAKEKGRNRVEFAF